MTATSSVLPVQRHPGGLGTHDRLFYSTMAVLLALAVFSGFARTYYLPLFSGGPTATIARLPFTPVVHIHAALFTSWVLLFIGQTALVAQRQVALHRKLDIAGAVLAAGMVISGVAIRIWEARLLAGVNIDASAPLFVLSTLDVITFAAFVTTAIILRRNTEAHKRLMLLAYVSILNAAVDRIPGLAGPYAADAVTLLPLVAAMTYDFASRGYVHRTYLWGGTLLVLVLVGSQSGVLRLLLLR